MAEIGNIPDIIEVKHHFDVMKQDGLITEWELPYENILTRRSAAIFFYTPSLEADLPEINTHLSRYDCFRQQKNTEKNLSELEYRVEFTIDKGS